MNENSVVGGKKRSPAGDFYSVNCSWLSPPFFNAAENVQANLFGRDNETIVSLRRILV